MKKILLFCITLTITGLFNVIQAQNRSGISDKALSDQYKHEINVLNLEIKTLKVKLKGEPRNVVFRSELESKQAKLKEVKSNKKTVDNAIKSKVAAEKAAKKAEKANKTAQKRAEEAQKLKN